PGGLCRGGVSPVGTRTTCGEGAHHPEGEVRMPRPPHPNPPPKPPRQNGAGKVRSATTDPAMLPALGGALEELARYRRATNFLAAAQLYLQDNFLVEVPLRPEHIKDRLLGHWGTCPGINLVYAHLNRLILRHY